MMIKRILFFLFVFTAMLSFAQKRDYQWYFDFKKGMHFNSGPPVQIATGQQTAIEASSAMADSVTGALLFYMDNDTMYDNTNVQLPNGKGMSSAATPTQILTLPMPGNTNKYYVILSTDPQGWGPPSNVSYSVVDMTLNGGKGDVVPAQKNIFVVSPGPNLLSEGLTAVKHANGYDWWVLAHGLMPGQNGMRYYKFLITSAGVQPSTFQDIGTNCTNNTSYLVASPDGKKVSRVDIQGHINLFDFDRCTGTLSNFVDMSEPYNSTTGAGSFYGCAFSPDSKVLYVTCYFQKQLYQFDLTAANIPASKAVVWSIAAAPFNGFMGMQLAPDGKIYFVHTNTKLCAINNPNVIGTGCNPATVNALTWSLVNNLIYFPNYNLGPTSFTANAGNDATICSGGTAQLNVTAGSSYQWSPAAGLSCVTCQNPVASPVATTTYVVSVSGTCGTSTDTVKVSVVSATVANAGGDATICSGSSTTLNANGGGTYVWIPSSGINNTTISNPTASPSATTSYSVVVQLGSCPADTDEVIISVTASTVANAGLDNTICPGSSASLSASGGNTYLWIPSSGISNPTISNPTASPSSTSTYSVVVQLGNCPADTDQVMVFVTPAVIANAGPDQSVCPGTTVTLQASGGGNYSWTPAVGLSSTTAAAPSFYALSSCTYSVIVQQGNCPADTDAVSVLLNPLPVISAGPNVTIAPGDSVMLTASGGISYFWTPAGGLSNTSGSTTWASPTTTTQYCATGYDALGCTNAGCVTVQVIPEIPPCGAFYIPNAFSPNEDNENDVFTAYIQPSCVKEYNLIVYNRWGEKIFSATGGPASGWETLQWDGTFRGVPCDPAVYAYYCRVVLITGKEISKEGNVSLVR